MNDDSCHNTTIDDIVQLLIFEKKSGKQTNTKFNPKCFDHGSRNNQAIMLAWCSIKTRTIIISVLPNLMLQLRLEFVICMKMGNCDNYLNFSQYFYVSVFGTAQAIKKFQPICVCGAVKHQRQINASRIKKIGCQFANCKQQPIFIKQLQLNITV